MLEFPTFEEMVTVMNAPTAPSSPIDHAGYLSSDEAAMSMSAEEMLLEIFFIVRALNKNSQNNSGLTRGSIAQDAILMDNPSQL